MDLVFRNPVRSLAGMCLLTLACALLIVSNASAAGTVSATAGAITFTAGSGDGANSVTVDHNGLAFTISDTVALTAGAGCTQVNSTQASCAGTFGKQVTLNLGDGLDLASVTANVPSTGRVTVNGDADGASVSAGSASAAIAVNSTAGMFTTGSGPDVLVLGGSGFTSTIVTGASADSVTFTTDLPKATFDPDTESSPYPNGTSYLNNAWPVYVHTGEGGDYIDGSSSSGAFWYEAGGGCDLVIAGTGDDWFNAGTANAGDDTLIGGAGNDTFDAYADNDGDDMYYGGAGNDTLNIWDNSAEEMFDGGTGSDWVTYPNAASGTPTSSLSLDGLRNDGILGNDIFTSTVEKIGGAVPLGGTTFIGNADANTLVGNNGPDTFTGGPGSDTMTGNGGDDTFYAWDGQADTVNCGTGTDTVDADTADTVTGCDTQAGDTVTRH